MFYYKIEDCIKDRIQEQYNFEDDFSFEEWNKDFIEFLNKNNLLEEIKIEDFLIGIEYDPIEVLIYCKSTTIENDEEIEKFLKNTSLQNKLLESAKDYIIEINEKLRKLYDINYIPSENFTYKMGNYYINNQLISIKDPTVEWKLIQFNTDIIFYWEDIEI